MTNSARLDGPAIDPRHMLIIGAGPGLGISLYGRDHAPGLLVYNASQ
jgi:hypothetical protein